jgi:hypothetical protein
MQKEDEAAERLFTLFFLHEEEKAQKLTEDATTSKETIREVSVNAFYLSASCFIYSLLLLADMNLQP